MESGIKEILKCGDEEFSFRLNRKPETELGPVTIDQWWMHVNQLYAQREHKDEQEQNHRSVLEFYWAKVREDGAINVRDAQERYLLGSLLPKLRSLGSRRIFLDASLRRQGQTTRTDETRNLDELLKSSRASTASEFEFHKRSWVSLGRDAFPDVADALYETMLPQLLDEPCAELEKGDCSSAKKLVEEKWDNFHRSISRRSGKPDEKLVLDIFSYEARAAFHHCYSVVWGDLLPHLADKYDLNQETVNFLEFWHKERISPELSNPEYAFSLFHGHVFGLHPGLARFLLTSTGRELMGECLLDVKSDDRLGRLYNGFLMSLFDYAERWTGQNTSRHKTREFASGHMADVVSDEVDRRYSRDDFLPKDEN